MIENHIERGELYFVHLDPAFGREIGGYKVRPVLVISINDIHRKTRIVTVIPGTSTPAVYRNVVEVKPDATNGLKSTTFFQCHQVRSVDQGRMTAQAFGRISANDFRRITDALKFSLGLID